MRLQRRFVVAINGLCPWEKVHELKQRWLQVFNSSRSDWLYDGKFRKLVDASEEKLFVGRENVDVQHFPCM
ncbi:hypothetical protein A7M48_19720 [Acinetobacter baumannii]|nr:hypothetical protein A7M48_19720 [Acinetobacter baumannii]